MEKENFYEKYKNILSDSSLSLNRCGISVAHLTEASVSILKTLYTNQDLPKEYFLSDEITSQMKNPLVIWGLIKHNQTPDELLIKISQITPRPFSTEILKKERISDDVIDAIVGDKTMQKYLIKYLDDEIRKGNRKIFGKGVSKRMAEKYCKELEYRPYAITRDLNLLYSAIADTQLDTERAFPYILSNHYAPVSWRDKICQEGHYDYNLLDVLQPTSYMQNEIYKHIEESWLIAKEDSSPEMLQIEKDSLDRLFYLIENKKMSEEHLALLILEMHKIDIGKYRNAGMIEDFLDYLGQNPYSKKTLALMISIIAPKLHPMFFSKTYQEHFDKIERAQILDRMETLVKEYPKKSMEYDRGNIGRELKCLIANTDNIDYPLVEKLMQLNNPDVAMGILQNQTIKDSQKYSLLQMKVSNDAFVCAFIHIFRNENLTYEEKMSVLQSVYNLKAEKSIDYLTGSETINYKARVSLPKTDKRTISRIKSQLQYINNVYVDDEFMKKKIDAYIHGLEDAPKLKEFEQKYGLRYNTGTDEFSIQDSEKLLHMPKKELKQCFKWLEDNGYNMANDFKQICLDNDTIDGWCKFAIHLDKYKDIFDAITEVIDDKYSIGKEYMLRDGSIYMHDSGEVK